jgi:hypothetical protein
MLKRCFLCNVSDLWLWGWWRPLAHSSTGLFNECIMQHASIISFLARGADGKYVPVRYYHPETAIIII